MNLDQYITAANIIEHVVDADEKAHGLLEEALSYQRIANRLCKTDYNEAKHVNGYYRDDMHKCMNRVFALTGIQKEVVRRVLIEVATARL